MMISLDLAKSSEVRKAGDQSNYKITFQVLVKKHSGSLGVGFGYFFMFCKEILKKNFAFQVLGTRCALSLLWSIFLSRLESILLLQRKNDKEITVNIGKTSIAVLFSKMPSF